MRKYNLIMAFSVLTYLVISVLLYVLCRYDETGEDMVYKVEINRIMAGLEEAGAFSEPDLRNMVYVKGVYFLPQKPTAGAELETVQELTAGAEPEAVQDIESFYRNHNGLHSTVQPLAPGGKLAGYVRFDYTAGTGNRRILWTAEGLLFFFWLMIFGLLWYVRQKVIRPFHVISEMPYELSKGNLSVEPEEDGSRFFGRFLWGIGMLRDALKAARSRTMELEKEKKLLLLSISHDIKIPLSAVKLYAKALQENMYDTEEQRRYAARQIGSHAGEIENFVKEIVSTASEDIFDIEVAEGEFYLQDYVEKVRRFYVPKCRLVMTELATGAYENKILKGDMNRAFEVMGNLMENALKYGDGRKISLSFYEEDFCQVIEVFNTGETVTAQELPHLFDSFYRGSNARGREGSGLGLAVSRRIMQRMEGDIFARREADGMCFGLVFRLG